MHNIFLSTELSEEFISFLFLFLLIPQRLFYLVINSMQLTLSDGVHNVYICLVTCSSTAVVFFLSDYL